MLMNDLCWNVSFKDHKLIKSVNMPSKVLGSSKVCRDCEALMVKSTPQCRYFSVKPLVCVNCGGRGHLSASCLTKKIRLICFICGESGHRVYKCPNRVCFNCFQAGHWLSKCPFPKRNAFARCPHCSMKGHSEVGCPDQWRKFHATVTTAANPQQPELAVNRRVFCSNCSARGHFAFECRHDRMDKFVFPAYPFTVLRGGEKGSTRWSSGKASATIHPTVSPNRRIPRHNPSLQPCSFSSTFFHGDSRSQCVEPKAPASIDTSLLSLEYHLASPSQDEWLEPQLCNDTAQFPSFDSHSLSVDDNLLTDAWPVLLVEGENCVRLTMNSNAPLKMQSTPPRVFLQSIKGKNEKSRQGPISVVKCDEPLTDSVRSSKRRVLALEAEDDSVKCNKKGTRHGSTNCRFFKFGGLHFLRQGSAMPPVPTVMTPIAAADPAMPDGDESCTVTQHEMPAKCEKDMHKALIVQTKCDGSANGTRRIFIKRRERLPALAGSNCQAVSIMPNTDGSGSGKSAGRRWNRGNRTSWRPRPGGHQKGELPMLRRPAVSQEKTHLHKSVGDCVKRRCQRGQGDRHIPTADRKSANNGKCKERRGNPRSSRGGSRRGDRVNMNEGKLFARDAQSMLFFSVHPRNARGHGHPQHKNVQAVRTRRSSRQPAKEGQHGVPQNNVFNRHGRHVYLNTKGVHLDGSRDGCLKRRLHMPADGGPTSAPVDSSCPGIKKCRRRRKKRKGNAELGFASSTI